MRYNGKQTLTFTDGKRKMNAVAVEVKDFSKETKNFADILPKVKKAKSFSVDAEIFGAVVKKVVTAAADKKCFQQPYKGVFVEVEGKKITLSATDGTIKFNFKTTEGLIIESLADGTGAAKIHCPAVASSDTTAAVNLARLNRALSEITAEYVMVGKATVNSADILTIHDNNESFCYFISEISKERDLQKAALHIEQLELEIAKKNSEVEAEREKVAQAQKVIKAKESEIEIAEEILKSAKKNLRQDKNALKKAEDTQKDAETISLSQQAIDKAEGEVADAKKALEEKQAQYKKLAEWVDSFPVQKVYEKFNWLAEQLANAKNIQAELKNG